MDAAIALAPDHISTYGLTFEQGTAFWSRRLRGELAEVDEELQRDMYALAIDRLTAAGYEHYEVSNFARPGCRSRHNEVVLVGRRLLRRRPGRRPLRRRRPRNEPPQHDDLSQARAGRRVAGGRTRRAVAEARARELLVFGLRRIEGVSRRDFARRTGYEIDELVAAPLRKFVDLGLLADDGERIRLTREGLFVSDAIWPEML